MTHSLPGGTTWSKESLLGSSPGYTYGSVIGCPLTAIFPAASQQTTWSPATPITRLTKSVSPTGLPSARAMPPPTRENSDPGGLGGANTPSPSKTTTSPRCTDPKR